MRLNVPSSSAISTNSITIPDRGLKNGWEPKGVPLEDTLEETVQQVVAASKQK